MSNNNKNKFKVSAAVEGRVSYCHKKHIHCSNC